jgi:putative nucleotidyltransferase with HDIG domain
MSSKFIIDPADIQNLAPMPVSVGRLAQMISRAETDFAEVVGVIEFDQALTTNVLRWANSAWSGAKTPILSVRDAVIRLGMAAILKLAVGHTLSAPLTKCSYPSVENEDSLWRHSITAALVAEHLGSFAKQAVPPVSFTASLVHDVGKLLLGRYLKDEDVLKIRQLVHKEKIQGIEAEQQVLGTDHARVGGEIAWFWKFPDELSKAIEQHHSVNPAPDPLLGTVQIANSVANFINGGNESDDPVDTKIPYSVIQHMGLSPAKIQLICGLVREKRDETLKLWAA